MVEMNPKLNLNLLEMPKEVGKTPDGEIIYETKSNKTGNITKFSIPEENKDKFEKLVDKIHKKYGKYDAEPEKVFVRSLNLAVLGGAILGSALTASLIKTKSKIGRFAKTIGGALGGSVIAVAALTTAVFYPLIKYTKTLKNMGYKLIENNPMLREAGERTSKTEVKELSKTEKQ